MDELERDNLLADLLADYGRREQILQAAVESGVGRQDLSDLVATADQLWFAAHAAPPLEEDPVAAMLGLIPDPSRSLSAKSLTTSRKRAGLSIGDVAKSLLKRGWDVHTRDVFGWENRSSADVPPALIQAIAEIVDAVPDELTTSSDTNSSDSIVAEVRRSAEFQKLVRRWARVRDLSEALAAASLERRLVTTVHRGQVPDAAQLLQSLDELVSSVESGE